ncbi:MAG: tetratricopeptide repeat protein [Pseudomonadota bacterium]
MLRNAVLGLVLAAVLSGCGLSTSEEIQSGIERARELLDSDSFREADLALKEVITLDPANVEAMYLRGRALAGSKAWVEAYAHFHRAASIDPDRIEYGIAAIELEIRARRWSDALKRLTAMQDRGLPDADYSLWRARIAAGQQEFELAERLFNKATALSGTGADVLAEAAQAALGGPGGVERASELIERAVSIEPEHPAILLTLARIKLGGGEEEEGIAILRRAVAADEENTAAALTLANLEFAGGEVDAAGRRYEHLVSRSPFDENAVLAFGEFLARTAQISRLREFVATIEVRSPGLEGARSYLNAITLVEAGNIESALGEFDNAVLLLPSQTGAWLSLGRAALKNGELNRAENALARALEISPRLVPAELELARIDMLRLDPSSAVERLRRLDNTNRPFDEIALALSEAELLMRRARSVLARTDEALASDQLTTDLRQDWHRMRARALEALGEEEEASALYAEILTRNPDDTFAKLQSARLSGMNDVNDLKREFAGEIAAQKPEALLAVAIAHLRAGETDTAKQLLQSVVENDPRSYQANLYLGLIWHEAGEFEPAKGALKTVLGAAPGDPLANQSLGAIAQLENRPEQAKDFYERALRSVRELPVSLSGLAEVQLGAGEVFEALRHARAAVNLVPDSIRGRFILANALVENNELAEAERVLASLVQDAEGFERAWALRGRVARERGELAKAIEHYRRAQSLNPRFANALIGLVDALSAAKRFDDAVSVLRAELAERPKDGLLLRLLGVVEMNAGRLPRALANLERAFDADAQNSATAILIARVASATGDDQKAARALRAIEGRQDAPALASLMLGMILERLSNPAEAMAAYRGALLKAPDLVPALNNLAWLVHREGGQPEEALRLARRAYLLEPASMAIADTLGKILIDQGLAEEAYSTLREAVVGHQPPPWVVFRLARASQATGRTDEAQRYIAQALEDKRTWAERDDAQRFALSIRSPN